MQAFLALVTLSLFLPMAAASDAVIASNGLWIAEGEWNKDWRMVVALEQKGIELIGRVEKMIPVAGGRVHTLCDSCKGELKSKPLKGMVFITGLRENGLTWTGGRVIVLEPGSMGSGRSVDCELQFKGDEVHFRGYVRRVALGKTVIWKRYSQ